MHTRKKKKKKKKKSKKRRNSWKKQAAQGSPSPFAQWLRAEWGGRREA
jgi:hypothetical protein